MKKYLESALCAYFEVNEISLTSNSTHYIFTVTHSDYFFCCNAYFGIISIEKNKESINEMIATLQIEKSDIHIIFED